MIIYNLHSPNTVPLGTIRIDRKTKLGNPFIIGRDGSRKEVISKFEIYARHRLTYDIDYKELIKSLIGHNLACWCAPKECHGDILIQLTKELNNQ